MSDQNHLIEMLNKRKTVRFCHGNVLKPYFARNASIDVVADLPVFIAASAVEEEEMSSVVALQPWLKNSDGDIQSQLGNLTKAYPSLFSHTPTCTT